MATVAVSDAQFEAEVTNSDIPVVVDFWAEWCGPCRMLAPTIDQLGEEFTDKVSIGKLNIDDYKESAAKYGVRSIPTVLFFNKGELMEKFTGVAEKKVYRDKIEALVSKN